MARTKKQTIDAASARKRQYREEVLNRSLVMNAKKEEKLDSSCSETTSAKRDKSKYKLAGVASSAMSISPKSAEEYNILPQAVVRVTDIYRSQPEIMSEECLKKTRDISPRSRETNSSGSHRESISKNIFEEMEKNVQQKKNQKMSFSPKSKDIEASFRELKSESDRVRCEKSKKTSPEESPVVQNSSQSPKRSTFGRRSPRHYSPNSPRVSPQEKATNSCSPTAGMEKQKINIFTDNIGKDLGKRVRSPRRLSEDMIALPIFSYRKVGQSPKDNSGFYKCADEASSVGFSNSDNFKSPNGTHKKMLPRISPQKGSECLGSDTSLVKTQCSPNSNTPSEQPVSENVIKSSCGEIYGNNVDLGVNSNKVANKLLMSSICRDIMKEMTSSRRDLFMRGGTERKQGVKDESDDKQCYDEAGMNELKDVNMKASELGDDTNSYVRPDESEKTVPETEVNTDELKPDIENKETNDVKPSLLCAMLVGGADVAEDYTQTRERYNPEVTEISDSETEQSKEAFPIPPENMQSSIDEKSETNTEAINEENENESYLNNEIELKTEVKSEPQTDILDPIEEEEKMCVGNIKNEIEVPKTEKKSVTGFLSELKNVDEDVLKLLDIDVEDQFMEVPCTEEIIKEAGSETETELYKLISSLGIRLKGNTDVIDIDVEEIEKIIESCPKGHVPIVSSSSSEMKWKNILDRLENEKSKVTVKSKHKLKKEKLAADMDHLVEKMSASTLQNVKEMRNQKEMGLEDNSFMNTNIKEECEKNSEMKDVSSSPVEKEATINEPVNCLMSTSSSSLNGSLCELDLDSMTTAATQALKVPELGVNSTPESSLNLMSGSEAKCTDDVNKTNHASKRTFQKAKTCGDFSIELPSTSSKTSPLRRSNSSPQLKSEALSQASASSNSGKDQVRSKLGGKIPVPGTSYSSKSTRKSWRKPRLIMDPKPLDVLLQFVSDENESKDVFTSEELQKYLWMPSHRMIVTPEMRNEMNLADKTAENAWERKVKLMQEEEERQRKNEEEIDQDYLKHEPDFDEVDGMLFMSFSSEVELQAHVRVEKALEWDKDDTMLRISRAKTFEETKALNGDMKGVKMKKLRGQHMRWKKYRRMYSSEVQAVLVAKEKNIPLEEVKILGKTSDISKIKGSRKKSFFRKLVPESKENESTNVSFSFDSHENGMPDFIPSQYSTPECKDFQSCEENIVMNKSELSPKSRRRFNFSDQRAHKQLFKELDMDWEDRMIHRKLGGWSLKGNRPKKFSQAARKRELKEQGLSGGTETLTNLEYKPPSKPSGTEFDTSYDSTFVGCKKKKLSFPLLTERMARNCLKTLELSDDIAGAVRRNKRKKRSRENSSNSLPSLIPILSPMATYSITSTPQSSVATVGSSEKMDVSTPEVISSPSGSTVPTPPPSLSLDLLEETVMEGVEIAPQTLSPSVSDGFSTPQVKSCSKPGCRYGCICHLCAVNEVQSDIQSPVSKSSSRACDKEYCRLGCICESLDPEQPVPTQAHCGKPSCMLECNCSTPGIAEGNEDIPFLSSMKQKPRAGERFSNLPRREKTHRTAKNLDAITRKAMMLYETSEIYCERVERARKKPESSMFSPTNTLNASPPTSSSSFNLMLQSIPMEKSAVNNHPTELTIDVPETAPMESTVFSAVNLVTSEVATVTASQLSSLQSGRSQLFPWRSKRVVHHEPEVDFEIDEVRLTRPIVEPSAHKRKRKSHPLSDEIFSVSTCARILPFLGRKHNRAQRTFPDKVEKLDLKTHHVSHEQNYLPSSNDNDEELNLKISGICSLSEQNDSVLSSPNPEVLQKDDFVDLTLSTASTDERPEKSDLFHSQTSSQFQGISKTSETSNKDTKMQHGWHTSMVCLKAKAAPKAKNLKEDDVQEEDEVKLLEFAANCNWDSAKKEVLSRVASCLTRNQYPQPKLMNVCEFVVEILPKAKQPSLIPSALRAKLPGQMYSIRVRITRRDDSLQSSQCDVPVIDLSKTSPLKEVNQKTPSLDNQPDIVINSDECVASSTSGSLITAPPRTPKFQQSLSSSSSMSSALSSSSASSPSIMSNSTESYLQSSVGISGFSRICINSNDPPMKLSSQSKSAPGSRRSSLESFKECKVPETVDDVFGTKISHSPTKPLDLGKLHILSKSCSSSLTPVSKAISISVSKQSLLSPNSNSPTFTVHSSRGSILVSHQSPRPLVPISSSLKQHNTSSAASLLHTTLNTLNRTKKLNTSPTSLLTPGVAPKVSSSEKPSLKIPSYAVTTGKPVSPVIGAKNVKELKYVQMLYEVDGQNEKKKTLIAVPISLTGSTIDVNNKPAISTMPILTVPMPCAQAKGMPLLAPRNKSKLPHLIQNAPVIMKLPQMSSVSRSDNTNIKPVQLIPLSVSSLPSKKTPVPSTVSPSVSLPNAHMTSSCEETIMVFDKSHLSASEFQQRSFCKEATTQEPTLVTQSRDRPISSSEISPPNDDLSSKETNVLSIASEKSDDRIQSDVASQPSNESETSVESKTTDPSGICVDESPVTVEKDSLIYSQGVNGADLLLSVSSNSQVSGKQSFDSELPESKSSTAKMCLQHSSVSENPRSDMEEDGLNALSDEAGSKNFEVVDMDDLLIIPSDTLSTGEYIDICSDNCNTPFETNEQHASNCIKRRISPDLTDELDCPGTKKMKLLNDIPAVCDEDSNLSVVTASPQSYTSQAKSCLSSAISSCSNEDYFINALSSDEEIDVGENIPSFQQRVEKAWENDHSSMFCKIPVKKKLKGIGQTRLREALKIPSDRVEYHNYLERTRRAKMKELFDNLGDVMLTVPGMRHSFKLADGSALPKATILNGAKATILHLEDKATKQPAEVESLINANKKLLTQLKNLKAHLLTNNMSGRAIAAIINKVSRSRKETKQEDEGEVSTSLDKSSSSQTSSLVTVEMPAASFVETDVDVVTVTTEPVEEFVEVDFYPV